MDHADWSIETKAVIIGYVEQAVYGLITLEEMAAKISALFPGQITTDHELRMRSMD